MARSATDVEISQRYRNMARAFRTQADDLKAKKKVEKNTANSQRFASSPSNVGALG
jgi:hypothetical protein